MLETIGPDVAARMNTKIEKTDGCWWWTAATDNKGYGHMKVNGVMEPAHRVSWVVHNGQIPRGLGVLHRCDQPLCVNPAHLFLGTPRDNALDRQRKGRGQKALDAMRAAKINNAAKEK